MFKNILVVCIGNVCRSPYGEALLKVNLPNHNVSSAGVAVNESGISGKPWNATGAELARSKGIETGGHEARQLTRELCATADLILVMEKKHISMVESIDRCARGKVMMLSHWIGKGDISDPHRKSSEVFEHSYAMIEKSALSWVDKLI